MITLKKVDVLFVVGFGTIVREREESCKFYSEILGLPLKEYKDGYEQEGMMKHLTKQFTFFNLNLIKQFMRLYLKTLIN